MIIVVLLWDSSPGRPSQRKIIGGIVCLELQVQIFH